MRRLRAAYACPTKHARYWRRGSSSSHYGVWEGRGAIWLGWGGVGRACSAGRARRRPSEGQGSQELGPGGEYKIGREALEVVEEADAGSERLAGASPGS